MSDIYRTLPDNAGEHWLKDTKKAVKKLKDTVRDPLLNESDSMKFKR